MEDKQTGISIRFIREYDASKDTTLTFADVEALRFAMRRHIASRPHLHDVDRAETCWCGAEPGEPHKVD